MAFIVTSLGVLLAVIGLVGVIYWSTLGLTTYSEIRPSPQFSHTSPPRSRRRVRNACLVAIGHEIIQIVPEPAQDLPGEFHRHFFADGSGRLLITVYPNLSAAT